MNRILLFYKYITLESPSATKEWLTTLCSTLNLRGRILLATEGINGTLGGTPESTEAFIALFSAHPLFKDIDFKESSGNADDFPRLTIKVKREIVRLDIDPQALSYKEAGTHKTPEEVHALLSTNKEIVVFDARNGYESRIGAFESAIKPPISSFRELPRYIDEHEELFIGKEVLMYCTGGIRCERASAYLKSKGIAKNVYQLQGGIHRYVEQFPHGFFKGKNYVFDGRISLPVTEDILSTCDFCTTPCDTYSNCLNAQCNKHFIGCSACLIQFEKTCSKKCKELVSKGLVNKRPLKYKSSFCSLSI